MNNKIKQQRIAEIEAELVRQVRTGDSTSRLELAGHLRLVPSTVGIYVDRLVHDGYLRENKKPTKSSGRPPIILEPAAKAGEFVGVDFEAERIAVTSVDFSQQVLQQSRVKILASDTAQHVLKKIETAIAALPRRHRLLGIGVGVPGVVDREQGLALHYEHIRGWEHVAMVQPLAERFRVPVHLENNIRAMALAEQWFGAAKGMKNFVCIGIRSGIGAGVVVDGQLRCGHDGLAGEIGRWPSEPDAMPGQGNAGFSTLEQLASVRAILNRLTEAIHEGIPSSIVLKRSRVTLEEMLRRASEGDDLVLKTLERAARAVGRFVAQLSLLLNSELVIIAGPLAELTDAFLRPLRTAVATYASSRHSKLPRIEASRFGAFGGALGAAALAVHQWKPKR